VTKHDDFPTTNSNLNRLREAPAQHMSFGSRETCVYSVSCHLQVCDLGKLPIRISLFYFCKMRNVQLPHRLVIRTRECVWSTQYSSIPGERTHMITGYTSILPLLSSQMESCEALSTLLLC
jgi:hypothetical protein